MLWSICSKASVVYCWVKLNGKELSLQENQLGSNLMFFYEENLYLWKDAEVSRGYSTGVSLHSHTNQSKETLDFLENATDRCEDVANVLEGVMVKHG